MIKKMMFVMVSGLVLMFTSCGDQHKAQSLVKDFLNENLVDQDCSYERFSRLTPTAMISFEAYYKRTSNMLMRVPESYTVTGEGYRWKNVGVMANKGSPKRETFLNLFPARNSNSSFH